MKRCTKCGIEKELSQFTADNSVKSGLRSFCRSCSSNESRIWRSKNREKYNETQRLFRRNNPRNQSGFWMKYRHKNPSKYLFDSARSRAKKFGIEFSISLSDVVVPEICPVLGIPLKFGPRGNHPNSPSLDRRDPQLGYVPGNVQVISHRANTLKSDSTLSELKALVAWMEGSDKKELSAPRPEIFGPIFSELFKKSDWPTPGQPGEDKVEFGNERSDTRERLASASEEAEFRYTYVADPLSGFTPPIKRFETHDTSSTLL